MGSALPYSPLALISRRATAFLLEMIPVNMLAAVASGPFISLAIRHYDPWTRERGELIGANVSLAVGGAVNLLWFLLRDALPGLSWGKALMGLSLAASGGPQRPAVWQRALRNLCFVIPFFMLVEGAVACITKGPRLGDLVAGTRIVPAARADASIWTDRDGALLSLSSLLFAAGIVAGRYITEGMFNWHHYGRFTW